MARRFNPPPGWPAPPPGWRPPAGWRPPPNLPAPPPGWQLWVDDSPTGTNERRSDGKTWRPGWQLYTAAGVITFLALIGLLGGLATAMLLGGVAAFLAGLVGLIRPRWVGAPNRTVTGIATGAGLVLLVTGTAFAPPAPVAVPPPAPTATANPTSSPSRSTPSRTPSAKPTPTPRPSTAPPSTASATPAKPKAKPTPTTAPSTPAAGTALAALQQLQVKGRAPKTGYHRDEFGPGWATRPGGCDTRQTVLRRDLANVTILAADNCTVVGGRLNDPYTGAAFTAKTTTLDDLDIDHMVPLSDAWQKGAQQLSGSRRETFANDLLNLQTTPAAVNSAKGDGDAATWLPPNTSYRCSYVARQIAVKTNYGLWVTKAEKAAMTRVLARCPGQELPTAGSARKVVDRRPTLITPKPKPDPDPSPNQPRTDPRFPTCKAANAAGYGDYVQGKDPEYDWYRDSDGDGTVCER